MVEAVSYTPEFFDSIAALSTASADVIVPKMVELVKPASVIDVGCGRGWFLRKFIDMGVGDVVGFDGAPADRLAIPANLFAQVDLTEPFASGDESFDLALCLEVAEHLPELAAEEFIRQLCVLAPVVLFSAAVPMQGGEGHLNERWPDYWARLFAQHDYKGCGWPRIDIWDDERVAVWYRQNLLLFVSDTVTDPDVRFYVDNAPPCLMYRLVHPQLFGMKLGVSFL